MDNRNSNITHKIFDVLNNIKGFEVAMGNSATGKLIVNYKGINFSVVIDPIFNDNEDGRMEDNKPFEEVVKKHSYLLK
jgi:hypothetical protein|nr:MAG TPA: hypothetical protein [Caudoviricetes sp.]